MERSMECGAAAEATRPEPRELGSSKCEPQICTDFADKQETDWLILISVNLCYLWLMYPFPTAALVRSPRSVEHKLSSISIFEGCRAFHSSAALAKRIYDLLRKRREAARQAAVAQARRKLSTVNLDVLPFFITNF